MNILDKINEFNIPVVEVHPRFNSTDELIEYVRPLKGVEGFIASWANGHKVKAKADHYVAIHKTKDIIRFDRNIAEIIVNEYLDDIVPLLDKPDLDIVRAYEQRLDGAIENVLARLEGLVTIAKVLHNGNKKEVALKFIPNLIFKEDARFIFLALDGKSLRPYVIEKIKVSVNNGPKYEDLMKWMEG